MGVGDQVHVTLLWPNFHVKPYRCSFHCPDHNVLNGRRRFLSPELRGHSTLRLLNDGFQSARNNFRQTNQASTWTSRPFSCPPLNPFQHAFCPS
ncbi:hypothetical protein Hypma_013542 [Hypsizygus marmoreus]|uniref:Uncharacterized protein n=1 Tax=Hypsizygus marmoreus TaxID=39966 RepID=A0A369JKT0_HYPMA|nr:hypothetical protein Hypma_013542 [Hypsizygus marmoreus]